MGARISDAIERGFSYLRTEAIADHQTLYNRTSIDLGTAGEVVQQDMAQRQANWKQGGNITKDPEMMALQFNYGKYLLIQSSRPGSLPANLQGIWNRDFRPGWDSKFIMNINLQMNYWLAQPLDLREVAAPVVDFLDRIALSGREVSREMYGAEGWYCHHNTDIAGNCVPYHGNTIRSALSFGWFLGGFRGKRAFLLYRRQRLCS